MENQEVIQIIDNLKGRRNYEEKKASKLGYSSLYEYFEEYDEGIEFDPIAFCVEFTEYESLNEFYGDYDQRLDTYYDLNEYTTVIPIDDYSFIIANF